MAQHCLLLPATAKTHSSTGCISGGAKPPPPSPSPSPSRAPGPGHDPPNPALPPSRWGPNIGRRVCARTGGELEIEAHFREPLPDQSAAALPPPLPLLPPPPLVWVRPRRSGQEPRGSSCWRNGVIHTVVLYTQTQQLPRFGLGTLSTARRQSCPAIERRISPRRRTRSRTRLRPAKAGERRSGQTRANRAASAATTANAQRERDHRPTAWSRQ